MHCRLAKFLLILATMVTIPFAVLAQDASTPEEQKADVREAFNLGSRAAGDMRQSFPRHSATTFLVPSSVHSVCLSKFLCQEN